MADSGTLEFVRSRVNSFVPSFVCSLARSLVVVFMPTTNPPTLRSSFTQPLSCLLPPSRNFLLISSSPQFPTPSLSLSLLPSLLPSVSLFPASSLLYHSVTHFPHLLNQSINLSINQSVIQSFTALHKLPLAMISTKCFYFLLRLGRSIQAIRSLSRPLRQ